MGYTRAHTVQAVRAYRVLRTRSDASQLRTRVHMVQSWMPVVLVVPFVQPVLQPSTRGGKTCPITSSSAGNRTMKRGETTRVGTIRLQWRHQILAQSDDYCIVF